MKLKKIICLFLCAITCFLGCACDASYYSLPRAKFDKNGNLIYKGNVYVASNLHQRGYSLKADQRPILRTYFVFWITVLSVHVDDKDENIIGSNRARYQYRIKEGFYLPSKAFECNLSAITLRKTLLQEDEEKVEVKLDYPVSNIAYTDEADIPEDRADRYVWTYFDFEFADYSYLKSDSMVIIEYEGDFYIHSTVTREDYKIKPEYQEAFRNAIEELNS